MLEIENVPRQLKKKGLEEKLVKFCEENDIVFIAYLAHLSEKNKKSDIDIAIEFDKQKPESLLDLVHVEN